MHPHQHSAGGQNAPSARAFNSGGKTKPSFLKRIRLILSYIIAFLLISWRSRQQGQEHTESMMNRSDPRVSSAKEYLETRRLLAVTDSFFMISHAAESGLDLKKEHVEAILNLASKIDATGKASVEDKLTPEIESKFWEAFSRISYLVKPAIAASIRDRSLFLSLNKDGLLSRDITFYNRLIWLFLPLTLALHFYYFVMNTMIAEAQESIRRFDAARTAAFTAIAVSDQQSLPQVRSDIVINVGNACEALENWRSTNNLIAAWSFNRTHPDKNGEPTILSFVGQNAGMARMPVVNGQPLTIDSQMAENTLCKGPIPTNSSRIAEELSKLRVVDETTQRLLNRGIRYRDVVAQFILPLFYGALGAVASMARALSLSIRQIRYSRAFRSEHGMQIPLGALAGATIGLVVAPEALGTAFGLTTLGLAFGLGYSVDVFFAAIDGLVSRVAQRDATAQGDAARRP